MIGVPTSFEVDGEQYIAVTAGHIARPEPNSTPEQAMELLLQKARLVFGEQDWSPWEWSAREYGTREPRVIPFTWRNGAWVQTAV